MANEISLENLFNEMVESQGKRKVVSDSGTKPKVYYKTRISPILDYALGYHWYIRDAENNPVAEERPMGIAEGSQNLIYGAESSSKSTIMGQIAGNIARQFPLSQVYIFDIEKSWSLARTLELTKFSMRDVESKKLIIIDDKTTLDDFYDLIVTIYNYKRTHKNLFMYTSDCRDIDGTYLKTLQPTIVLVDSIAMFDRRVDFNTKDGEKTQSIIPTQTESARLAGDISRVWKTINPWLSETNIILLEINQKKDRIQMDIVPKAAEMHGMKQDEAMPGGKSPRFLANSLFFSSATGHCTVEKDGFDGFTVNIKVIKNRNNMGGGVVLPFINDPKNGGISYIRTTLEFCKSHGLITGTRKDKMSFVNDPDKTFFDLRKAPEEFKANRKLYKIMHEAVKPVLEEMFFSNYEPVVIDEEGDY